MTLEDLLDTLQDRARWLAVGRPTLLLAGFPIRRGYDKTISAILKEKPNQDRTDRLATALKEQAACGQKALQIVRLKQGERAVT